MSIRANRAVHIFSRALFIMLYACFFFVQFHTRGISAREFQWRSLHQVTSGAKGKSVTTGPGHSYPVRQLNKRFELQPALIIAALIFLIALTFFAVKKKYARATASLYTTAHYCSSLRGPPAIAPLYQI